MSKRKPQQEERIAVFLDFREFKHLETLRKLSAKLREMGRIIRASLYIAQDEIDKIREDLPEIAKLGIEPIVTIFSKEVKATLDIVERGYKPNYSVLIIGWQNPSTLNPALLEVREKKKLWILSEEGHRLEEIHKVADKVITFQEDQ